MKNSIFCLFRYICCIRVVTGLVANSASLYHYSWLSKGKFYSWVEGLALVHGCPSCVHSIFIPVERQLTWMWMHCASIPLDGPASLNEASLVYLKHTHQNTPFLQFSFTIIKCTQEWKNQEVENNQSSNHFRSEHSWPFLPWTCSHCSQYYGSWVLGAHTPGFHGDRYSHLNFAVSTSLKKWRLLLSQ